MKGKVELIAYLKHKIDIEDWHGVSDAANDLRVLEAQMPSKSGKQHRLMEMVARDPKAAKRLGIPQKVGKEYSEADVGKHFGTHKTEKRK